MLQTFRPSRRPNVNDTGIHTTKSNTTKSDTDTTNAHTTDTQITNTQTTHTHTTKTDTVEIHTTKTDTHTTKRHLTEYQCKSDMEEDLPIIVGGHTVARAIINHDKMRASKSASVAASHVSTPSDIQFCPFSDGSHGADCRGGVALAYRTPWLPQGWEQGWGAEGESTDISGNMVRKAWPYGYAATSLVMEGVGVLESLYAANEELERHLPVLLKHSSTVNVKATTDCQTIIQYVSTGMLTTNQSRSFPPQLIKKIHDLILTLQSHGVRVFVELHWCPRNMVPPLDAADAMAGKARSSGMGFCNVTKNLWTKAAQSVVMKELEPMLAGIVRLDRLPVSHISTGGGSTGKTENTTTKKTRRGKKEAKRAQLVNTSTGTANSQPQFPLPEAPLPSKPLSTEPTTPKPRHSTPMPLKTLQSKPMPTEQGTTLSDGATTNHSTKPAAAAPQGTQSPKVQAGKRKAEEEEESDGRPTKKSKSSPDTPTQEKQPRTMPAAWRMDPWTNVYIIDPRTGLFTETPVARAQWIRTNPDSTQVTGETNVFISDGVSPFCLAKPKGITRQD